MPAPNKVVNPLRNQYCLVSTWGPSPSSRPVMGPALFSSGNAYFVRWGGSCWERLYWKMYRFIRLHYICYSPLGSATYSGESEVRDRALFPKYPRRNAPSFSKTSKKASQPGLSGSTDQLSAISWPYGTTVYGNQLLSMTTSLWVTTAGYQRPPNRFTNR